MARFIPPVPVDEIRVKPERDVARALIDQLSDDCIIFHSYPWLRPERDNRTGRRSLRQGETDFVIVLPSHGFLVLEVKGGEIGYRPESREWYRNVDGDERPITDPFEQADRNMHYLKEQIVKVGYPGRKSPPFSFGYAVVFPDCTYTGPTPPGAAPQIVLSAPDMDGLGERIRGVLKAWTRGRPRPLDKHDLRAIRDGILPAFRLIPALQRQVEAQEEALVRMTDDQVRLLEFLASRRRAAIEGVAGSGKTMLAVTQARRFAAAGKATLLCCYNKGLAHWLAGTLTEAESQRITVRHFHALAHEWCERAGMEFVPDPDDPDRFWKVEVAELLMTAIEALPERFDAVVVDEGQDFQPDWWLPLELINRDGDQGAMYVFYDPAQNLFVKEPGVLPALGDAFRLPMNCRNTRKIAAVCGGILDVEVDTHPEAPEGLDPDFVEAIGTDAQQRGIATKLQEWLEHGRLAPSQIAILSPNRVSRSSMHGVERFGDVPVTSDVAAWKSGRGVLFSTIRAFKGLESDAVLMIDVPKPDSVKHFTSADYYVGASRAKHLLAVQRA